MKLRSDIVDPTSMKSNTERQEPKRMFWKIEIDDPKVAMLRRANDEPK
jgi:hypothetical protein